VVKWIGILSLVVFGFFILASLLSVAFAHQAPSGWAYPLQCCSGMDCRQIEGIDVGEGANGYTILKTGEVIPYHDLRLKVSPDGEYHWCSKEGKDTTPTVCLFIPPPGV